MSSAVNSQTISSAIQSGITSSKVIEAIAPVISEVLIDEMEQKQKSKKSR